MNKKHTPGPWFVDEESLTDVRTDGVDKLMWICDAPADHDKSNVEGMKQRLANARLIAAAPELLEALIKARDYVQSYADPRTLVVKSPMSF